MTIPSGVNYIEFYKEAARKGIKIKSKFPRVYIHIHHTTGAVRWMSKVWMGRKQTCEFFPFTEQGEKDAAAASNRVKNSESLK